MELKPCPFCGCEAEAVKDPCGMGYFAVCHKCEIRTLIFLTKEKAVKRWNRRADNG